MALAVQAFILFTWVALCRCQPSFKLFGTEDGLHNIMIVLCFLSRPSPRGRVGRRSNVHRGSWGHQRPLSLDVPLRRCPALNSRAIHPCGRRT